MDAIHGTLELITGTMFSGKAALDAGFATEVIEVGQQAARMPANLNRIRQMIQDRQSILDSIR